MALELAKEKVKHSVATAGGQFVPAQLHVRVVGPEHCATPRGTACDASSSSSSGGAAAAAAAPARRVRGMPALPPRCCYFNVE